AYVPLDPNFPAERLKYMLEDSGADAVLTSGPLPKGLEVPSGAPVLDIATHSPAVAKSPDRGPRLKDIAYVLYTSGSTGRPKGVSVPHGALVNFLHSMHESPG